MDTAPYLAQRRPLLWDAPVAFVLWSLEEAKVRIAERRYEAGETIYSRGEPERYLYFLTKGVLKIYKSYGGHKGGWLTGIPGRGWRLYCWNWSTGLGSRGRVKSPSRYV